jgi:hypothetical protein
MSLNETETTLRKLEALRAEQERHPTFERHIEIDNATRLLYALKLSSKRVDTKNALDGLKNVSSSQQMVAYLDRLFAE